MTRRDDSLRDLEVNLTTMESRAVTPPDEDDDGKDQCPSQSPEPGGIRRN